MLGMLSFSVTCTAVCLSGVETVDTADNTVDIGLNEGTLRAIRYGSASVTPLVIISKFVECVRSRRLVEISYDR